MSKFEFIDKQMELIGIPYEFLEWTQDISYPYFTGEQSTPEEISTEDGREITDLIITGWHRGKKITLHECNEKIKKHFHPVHGLRGETEEGVIIVFYEGGFFVPSGEADLHKIEIHLKILEWKGDF